MNESTYLNGDREMNPQKLFVEESIEINAPPAKVWDALTVVESTRAWADNFVGAGGEIISLHPDDQPITLD